MLRLFRRVGLSRPPPTPVCRLTGCQRPCFLEPSGRLHDFCGITHARVFDNKRIADLDRARWAGQGPGHGHGKRGSGPVPGGRFDENEEYWTEEMVLFWHPPSVFSQWTPATFVVDHVSLVRRLSCTRGYSSSERVQSSGTAGRSPYRDGRWLLRSRSSGFGSLYLSGVTQHGGRTHHNAESSLC